MHPKNLQISNYTYDLPDERIAQYPLPERDSSKLLIYKDGKIEQDIYRNLAQHLPTDSFLVFNNTKVVHARIFFENASGGKIEVFCLEPADGTEDMLKVMSTTKTIRWKCMVGRASKWKQKVLHKKVNEFELTAELVDRDADSFIVEFKWQPEQLTFAEILDRAGVMPIPPYLHRQSEEIDQSRYQTVYAKSEGSVAAPTSGLHFTNHVMASLMEKGIRMNELTLHVGAGTFKPVKSETMEGHDMHSEVMVISIETIESLLAHLQGNIVAVGTTSLRSIESLFWMGVKVIQNPNASLDELEIHQWEPYEMESGSGYATYDALSALLAWMTGKHVRRLLCKTQIMIAPPYKLKIAKALITNFHQPNSTLLLLVAAVVGEDWKKIYDYALQNDFRFLSYGDGSLLFARG